MNVLLTLTHPNPDSLNGAVAKRITSELEGAGHSVRQNDLYQKKFDCCLDMADFQKWGNGEVPDDVRAEQKDVEWAGALVFVYPVWWNERPAKLKGWCDRVLTRPWAWDFGDQGLIGKLKGKKALVVTTYGSPKPLYDHLGTDIEKLQQPMEKGTLNFCGISEVKWIDEMGVLMQDRSANEAFVERVAKETMEFLG